MPRRNGSQHLARPRAAVTRALQKQLEAIPATQRADALRNAIRKRPWTALGIAAVFGAVTAVCLFGCRIKSSNTTAR
jgi:hypothetical protein